MAKMLDDARAEGMAEALEIVKRFAGDLTNWDGAEEAIAERQAVLRGGK